MVPRRSPLRFVRSFSTALDLSPPTLLQKFEKDVESLGMRLRGANEPYRIQIVGERRKKLPFTDREVTMRSLCSVLPPRWEELLDTEKADHPLHGLHAVPGGGKSFLVDSFMNMDLSKGKGQVIIIVHSPRGRLVENLTVMTDRPNAKLGWTDQDKNDFCRKWQKSIRLSWTFNREFEGSKAFVQDPGSLVAARLLHRYVYLRQ